MYSNVIFTNISADTRLPRLTARCPNSQEPQGEKAELCSRKHHCSAPKHCCQASEDGLMRCMAGMP